MTAKVQPIDRLPVWAVILTCATIAAIGMGVRQSMGLFMKPLSNELGLGIEVFSMAIGIANIVWGMAAPFTGAVADKFGSGRVVIFGGLSTASGLWLLYSATNPIELYVSGVFLGLGVAGAGINSLVGAVGRSAPPDERSAAVAKLGIGSGIGLLIALPYTHFLMEAIGWHAALAVLAATALIILPLAWPVSGAPPKAASDVKPQSLGSALSEAFSHPSFWLLNLGFFVCGFHVVFYAVHLPSYVASKGIDASIGVIALTVTGLGNLVGTYLAGQWGKKRSKKWGLTFIYLCRSAIFVSFLYLPIDGPTIIILSALLGVFWLSTVPLTSSMVATFYGPAWMTMLFGIVFFSHQVGSFLGAWSAGFFYDRTQSYDTMWWISVALGLFAALIHVPISEKPVRRLSGLLTRRQDAFARALIGGGDPRAAYGEAFGADALDAPNASNVIDQLMKEPAVVVRVRELRQMTAGRLQMSIEQLTRMLIDDREDALRNGNHEAAIAATMGLARLHGQIEPETGEPLLPNIADIARKRVGPQPAE